jgi:hypothetical protein
MTPLPAASAGTTLMGRGTSNVLSYRYASSPESGHAGYSTTNVASQQGYELYDSALTLRIRFECGWSQLQGIRTATYQCLRWSERVWSPPPESNRRPHPYHESRAHRCADQRFCRSRPTVDRQVMCSTRAGCSRSSPASYAATLVQAGAGQREARLAVGPSPRVHATRDLAATEAEKERETVVACKPWLHNIIECHTHLCLVIRIISRNIAVHTPTSCQPTHDGLKPLDGSRGPQAFIVRRDQLLSLSRPSSSSRSMTATGRMAR